MIKFLGTWERPALDHFNPTTGHYTMEADYVVLYTADNFIEIRGDVRTQEKTAEEILKAVSCHDELAELLESVHNGLKWYRAEHPEHYSPADDEMDERVAAALAKAGVK